MLVCVAYKPCHYCLQATFLATLASEEMEEEKEEQWSFWHFRMRRDVVSDQDHVNDFLRWEAECSDEFDSGAGETTSDRKNWLCIGCSTPGAGLVATPTKTVTLSSANLPILAKLLAHHL